MVASNSLASTPVRGGAAAPGAESIPLQLRAAALYDRGIAPAAPGAIQIKRFLERYAHG